MSKSKGGKGKGKGKGHPAKGEASQGAPSSKGDPAKGDPAKGSPAKGGSAKAKAGAAPAARPTVDLSAIPKGVSSWAVAYRQLKKDKVAVFSAFVLGLIGLVSILSPLLANSKPVVVSYKGGLYFPAFKDYLDENIPIPFGIPAVLKKAEFFSPAYKEIERPGYRLLPDWREIRADIDAQGPETQGDWYWLPPVPYYYNEDSSAIKLRPGYSMCHLTLDEVRGIPGETLEFVPKRPPGQELAKIEGRIAVEAGQDPPPVRGRLEFDPEAKQWMVRDVSLLEFSAPEEWLTFKPEDFDPDTAGSLVEAYDSPSGEAQVYVAWEWRRTYGLSGSLARDAATRDRIVRTWQARNDQLPGVESSEWAEVAGLPAIRVVPAEEDKRRWQRQRRPRPLRRCYLLFGVDRVFTVSLRVPEAGPFAREDDLELDALEAAVLPTIAVSPPSGETFLNGKVVEGEAPVVDGDRVAFAPGVEGTFQKLPDYLLGSDSHGRCVLSRLIHGTVIAGSVGIVSVGIYVFIGIILGALAGYFRGWVDLILSRVIEVVICFPTLFLIIMVVGFWQQQSIYLIMVALGLIRWTGVARLVRGEFLKVMSEEYVSAAQALGLPTSRIIFRHILPNAIAPVFVSASFGVAGAILVETSLSFLGFGVAPPTASWGEILKQGKEYVNEDVPHLIWAPGFCIFVTVTLFNLLGEGLRDALDPKLRK